MALLDVLARSDTDPENWAGTALNVGSVIIPNNPPIPALLTQGVSYSGQQPWGFAIVIQVDPLICASEKADMCWNNFDITKFTIVGKANAAALALAMTRLPNEA